MMLQLENGSQDQLAASVVGSVGDGGRVGGSEGGRPVIIIIRERGFQHCASCQTQSVELREAYVDDRLLR